EALAADFDTKIIGMIARSQEIQQADAEGCPFIVRYPDCQAAVQLRTLADAMLKECEASDAAV
ncbi:MAG: hypothetical protein J6P20_06075, partial [Oscillospiraceae bacterium]|nr:hypothetical protein [Oscillospiraceae bacterium]